MDRQAIFSHLAVLIADIVDTDAVTLTDSTTADDVAGWDSIAHIKLIIALEGEFGIRFTADEAAAPENVGKFVDLIQSKIDAI